ncbi:carbon storage regulator [Pseudomonas sp. WS 5021]|uniref:Translational regulator CsrA n=1 Tax=Pseudomonas hygromyciniae TaxID=2812000 RepID=A0ABX7K483_9PSED|nr:MULTISPECIES: carbon storage regulator [Pseudomonas]MBJ2264238.1 carbon storage regulator [Pseudomonas sp. MF6787]MBN0980737.1 carbon storage regulator [Pseudomonas hygromyciniae]NMX35811.1 carbon storage regulator [Pseudomonas sp. WS 5413]NMY29681.1 carbon storage regulator [Pseudomonas sp. WS 5021]QSB42482.1 carbon storage regulator [Pseudomonas hygromyciniae]
MLHIERKVGESIRLSDNIQVIVTKAANGTVRLAFDAPKEVKIYREEIYQRIQNGKMP